MVYLIQIFSIEAEFWINSSAVIGLSILNQLLLLEAGLALLYSGNVIAGS